jgi:hypothetical protein
VADDILLPVPEAVYATYVVPTSRPPSDAIAAVRQYLASSVDDHLRDLVQQLLDAPMCQISVIRASDAPALPVDLFRIFGASSGEVESAASASHMVVVQLASPPGWPPAHEWVARIIAAGIAVACDAPIIDTFVPKITSREKLERTYPDDRGEMRIAQWVLIPQSAGEEGLWLTTKGLGRFGLPELQAANVPPQLGGQIAGAMSGLAQALLNWWVDAIGRDEPPAFVRLPQLFEFGHEDVSAAHGRDGDPSAARVSVRLELDPSQPSEDTFLAILPPVDFSASTGDFFARLCQDLFGSSPDDVRQSRQRDAMERAIATAMSTIDDVRTRFVQRKLGLDQRLLVKFRLSVPGGNEYPWLFVNSWNSPEQIHGTNGNDAVRDPSVRVGRPLVIAASDVIDWAILTEAGGIVEGGWTNDVLAE